MNDDATMIDVSDTFCDVAIPVIPEESDSVGDGHHSKHGAESSSTTMTTLASRPLLTSVSVPEVHGRALRVMNHAGRILWKVAMGQQRLSAGVWAKLLQRTLATTIFGSTTASASSSSSLSSSSSSGGNNSNNTSNWLPSVWPVTARSSQEEEEEEAEDCWNEEDINNCTNDNNNNNNNNNDDDDECEAMEESLAEISPLPLPLPLPSSDDQRTATKRNRWSTLLRWSGLVVSDEEEGGGEEEEEDNDEPIYHWGYDGYKYHKDQEEEDHRPRKRVRTGLSC